MHSRVYAKLQTLTLEAICSDLRHNQKSPSIPVSGAARNRTPVAQSPGDHEQVLIADQSWAAKGWTWRVDTSKRITDSSIDNNAGD